MLLLLPKPSPIENPSKLEPPKVGLSSWEGGTSNIVGVLQHCLQQFGLSSWEGGTPGVFGVPQHYSPKFGLFPWEGGTPGVFGL